ncbi:hypothetical protein OUZ56_028612 [Daphnia magna]|uniref:Uncharacterized protein n=1 Tax=Daphnia magna TaxID=35525 RepID=A0ABR0B4H2_9CRUS|nr:hypothetical protein OUZ56_028612 [Daphnia magna]
MMCYCEKRARRGGWVFGKRSENLLYLNRRERCWYGQFNYPGMNDEGKNDWKVKHSIEFTISSSPMAAVGFYPTPTEFNSSF